MVSSAIVPSRGNSGQSARLGEEHCLRAVKMRLQRSFEAPEGVPGGGAFVLARASGLGRRENGTRGRRVRLNRFLRGGGWTFNDRGPSGSDGCGSGDRSESHHLPIRNRGELQKALEIRQPLDLETP